MSCCIGDDIQERLQKIIYWEERALRKAGLRGISLGSTEASMASGAMSTAASVASLIPGPGTIIGGLLSIGSAIANIFGGGVDTTYANPDSLRIFGDFSCTSDESLRRIPLFRSGDVWWLYTTRGYDPDGMRNADGTVPPRTPMPFPKNVYPDLTREMQIANIQTMHFYDNSGANQAIKACSNYAAASREWLLANMPRLLKEAVYKITFQDPQTRDALVVLADDILKRSKSTIGASTLTTLFQHDRELRLAIAQIPTNNPTKAKFEAIMQTSRADLKTILDQVMKDGDFSSEAQIDHLHKIDERYAQVRQIMSDMINSDPVVRSRGENRLNALSESITPFADMSLTGGGTGTALLIGGGVAIATAAVLVARGLSSKS